MGETDMNKEIILIISGETSGCVHVRLWNNMYYINANYEKYHTRIVTSPIPIFDANFLSKPVIFDIPQPVSGSPYVKMCAYFQKSCF